MKYIWAYTGSRTGLITPIYPLIFYFSFNSIIYIILRKFVEVLDKSKSSLLTEAYLLLIDRMLWVFFINSRVLLALLSLEGFILFMKRPKLSYTLLSLPTYSQSYIWNSFIISSSLRLPMCLVSHERGVSSVSCRRRRCLCLKMTTEEGNIPIPPIASRLFSCTLVYLTTRGVPFVGPEETYP